MIHNIKHEWLPNGNFCILGEKLMKEKHESIIRYFRKEYTKNEVDMFNNHNISIYEDFICWCNRI